MKTQTKTALAAVMAASTFAAAHAQAAADTYKAKCAMCHGADGLGATLAGKSMKTIPINDPSVAKLSTAELVAITKNGKNKMPAYNGKLPDDQIKELVIYLKGLQK